MNLEEGENGLIWQNVWQNNGSAEDAIELVSDFDEDVMIAYEYLADILNRILGVSFVISSKCVILRIRQCIQFRLSWNTTMLKITCTGYLAILPIQWANISVWTWMNL